MGVDTLLLLLNEMMDRGCDVRVGGDPYVVEIDAWYGEEQTTQFRVRDDGSAIDMRLSRRDSNARTPLGDHRAQAFVTAWNDSYPPMHVGVDDGVWTAQGIYQIRPEHAAEDVRDAVAWLGVAGEDALGAGLTAAEGGDPVEIAERSAAAFDTWWKQHMALRSPAEQSWPRDGTSSRTCETPGAPAPSASKIDDDVAADRVQDGPLADAGQARHSALMDDVRDHMLYAIGSLQCALKSIAEPVDHVPHAHGWSSPPFAPVPPPRPAAVSAKPIEHAECASTPDAEGNHPAARLGSNNAPSIKHDEREEAVAALDAHYRTRPRK